MRFRGAKTLRQSMRWLRSRMVNHGLILGYHRIADEPNDAYGMCVSPQNFAQHLAALRHHAHLISLKEMLQRMRQGDLLPRSVAITFDDGYVDNLNHAQPLLEQYQIPATFFIVSGAIGNVFWWDELKHWVFISPVLPDMSNASPIDAFAAGKTGLHLVTSQQRRHLLFLLYRQFLPLTEEARQAAMAKLCSRYTWARCKHMDDMHLPRPLTLSELQVLANRPCIEIGAHTVSHPLLTRLPRSSQMVEIETSKTQLENLLDRSITSFSYPNGAASVVTQGLVEAAGFECACTSINNVVYSGSDPYGLPRFWVPDWSGFTFERWLRRWL